MTASRNHTYIVFDWGWLGVAKVSCILRHRGVQLILAYSWARPAVIEAGKGRRGMFLFLLFLYFHSCSSFFPVPLFHLHYCLFYLFFLFSWRRHKMTHKGWRVVKPQHNQYSSDPLKSHFYIVKMGFTGVYIIMLISAKNIYCRYSLEPPHRGGSNECPQSMFWAEIWKISKFLSKKISVFGGEIFNIFE